MAAHGRNSDDSNNGTKAGLETKDEEIASLENTLHDWRHILLHADRWLRWQDDSYPAILVTLVTLCYGILWWWEPSILTTIALIVMKLCLIDYLVPTVFQKYFNTEEWTAEHERKLQQICIILIHSKDKVIRTYKWVKETRDSKPKQYFFAVIGVLSVVAFIGNLIPNLLLMWLLSVFLVLVPGLNHRGIIAKYYASTLQFVVSFIRQTKNQMKNKKE
ncbi:ADP-ribosylation factor-like protein 6-interacting protein 1 [Amphiura filiformis]|uniref:ADP-ribosylation factor-like protein 6-interacting protein 1 n=1 Tax=Amphiura filiformis TaxID=82378 RepID=UPI003B213F1A